MTANSIRHLAPLVLLASLAACTSSGSTSDGPSPAGAHSTADADGRPAETPPPPVDDPGSPASRESDQNRDAGAPATEATEISMQPGTRVELPDRSSLSYLRLVNDSRCGPDVQCIWAGDAHIALRWDPVEGSPRTFTLHTGKAPREQVIGALRVSLVSLDRGSAPAARLRVEAAGAEQ
jgi:hypothetical protein